jgi:hypothetical protein
VCTCLSLSKASQGFSLSLLVNLHRANAGRHGEMSQFVLTKLGGLEKYFSYAALRTPRSSPQVSIYQRSCKKRNCFSFFCVFRRQIIFPHRDTNRRLFGFFLSALCRLILVFFFLSSCSTLESRELEQVVFVSFLGYSSRIFRTN